MTNEPQIYLKVSEMNKCKAKSVGQSLNNTTLSLKESLWRTNDTYYCYILCSLLYIILIFFFFYTEYIIYIIIRLF